MPFGIGIILPNLSPIFYIDQNKAGPGSWPVFVPGLVVYVFYTHYGLAPVVSFKSRSKYWESWKTSWKHNPNKYIEKRGYETAIYEYEYINKLLYIEVGILILLTVLFYILPNSMKKGYLDPLLGTDFIS